MAIEAKAAVAAAAANGKNGHSLISDEKFRQLYGLALRLHLAAQSMNGAGGSVRGREAALAALVADLRAGDALIAEQGPRLLQLMSSDLAGSVLTPAGTDPEEALIDALTGAAADRLRGSGRVTVVFLPGRPSDLLMQEAQEMTAAARLPVLFVEDEPATIRPRRNGSKASPEASSGGAWLPAIPVDAQDVVAIYRVAHESMARARRGGGPTRIVCTRWQPAMRAGKRQQKGNGDAITKLEEWLGSRGLPAQEWRQEIAGRQRG